MSTISFVVPAYNEQENILLLVGKCEEVFRTTNLDIEYVFVDDGSTDETYTTIRRIAASRSKIMPDTHKVIGLKMSRNFGKEAAVWAGLEAATGDVVAVLDADLQHDPKQVLDMLVLMQQDKSIDCVAGYQEERNETVFAKMWRKLLGVVAKSSGEPGIEEYAVDFCVMRRAMVNGILKLPEYHKSLFNLFSWSGYKTKYVAYTPGTRVHGEDQAPKTTAPMILRKAMDTSSALIRFFARVCVALAVICLVCLIGTIILRIASASPVPGHAAVMSALFVGGGVLFLFLAIAGEYIARIYKQAKHQPVYILRGRVRSK